MIGLPALLHAADARGLVLGAEPGVLARGGRENRERLGLRAGGRGRLRVERRRRGPIGWGAAAGTCLRSFLLLLESTNELSIITVQRLAVYPLDVQT